MIKYLILILTIFLCGCRSEIKNDKNKINVAASIPPYSNFVKIIGGEKVNVVSIIPPSGNPHTFEPTPRQMRSMNFSEIYFKVGGSFEFEKIWLGKFESNWKIIDCSEKIKLIDNDPHIWLSPANAKKIIYNIYRGLVKLNPVHEEYFKANYEKYFLKLDSLDKSIKISLAGIKNRTIMVYHPALRYFAEQYGFTEISIEKEGKNPKAADLVQTIELAKSKNINVIFVDPKNQSTNAETITNEIGAEIIYLNPLEENYINNLRDFSEILKKKLN